MGSEPPKGLPAFQGWLLGQEAFAHAQRAVRARQPSLIMDASQNLSCTPGHQIFIAALRPQLTGGTGEGTCPREGSLWGVCSLGAEGEVLAPRGCPV